MNSSGTTLYLGCQDPSFARALQRNAKFTILINVAVGRESWSVRGNIVGGLPYFKSKEAIEREKKEAEDKERMEIEKAERAERAEREEAERTAREEAERTARAAVASGASASIFIATIPPKAEIYVGGKLVGISNEGELQVMAGTHQVRFVKDGIEKTETITINPGKNPTRFVNLK